MQQQDSESLGILWAEFDLVVRHTDFGSFHQDTVSHASFAVARKAGIPGVRSHDLGDTHGSLMLQKHVDIKTI